MPFVSDYIADLVSALPENPGVYQFFNNNGKIIYIGKAKNLKRRVSSYFTKSHDNSKTYILVRKIEDIKFIIVDTEVDALLLENSLIKKHQPRYNIMLKDDKSYPWICIKNEPFPRVFSTRRVVNDGSAYFGPYTSVSLVNTLLDLFKQLFALRSCNYDLQTDNIREKKYKVCLEYHIGNCKGPCIAEQNEKEYTVSVNQIRQILKGSTNSVISFLELQMKTLSSNYEYEEAHQIKKKIGLLQSYQSKSTIVSPVIHNIDVFSIVDDEQYAFVNFLKISNGAIIQAHTIEIVKRLSEHKTDILPTVITDIRERFNSTSKEIVVPFTLSYTPENIKITIPRRGDKLKLLELSERNAKYYKLEKLRQYEKANPQQRTSRVLTTIRNDLNLYELPVHIECFDNSNLQGQYPVAACVVFKNGKPSTKEYRHYNIKTVKGANDFASMEEVVYRRYKRLLDENKNLPQLIVIDGGKGQLSSALKSISKLNLTDRICIIGIAKKLEEIFFPNDSIPLYLNKNSETLKIIQHIRNEAHRFGISFYRKKHAKGLIQSELATIEGVGEKTVQKLLSTFKSVSKIKTSSIELLEEVIGKAKAKMVYKYFHNL